MKSNFLLTLSAMCIVQLLFSQNTLNNAGLTSATPSSVAYSLRQLSSAYTGNAVKVRRSSDNAEGTVAFDGTGAVSASSLFTFTAGATVGSGLGTLQTGTVSASAARTGTLTVVINKTGTITTSLNSATVTGTGSSFTTDLIVGDLLFNSANLFLGVVLSITSNTSLVLNNFAISTQTAIAYKTASAKVTGSGTNFTGELTPGDFLFNTANIYIGTVSAITSATTATINSSDAVLATAIAFKGSSAIVTGAGTSFTSLAPGNLLISNNVTLGIISSITSATSLILTTKAGSAVSALAYRTTAGTIAFSSFYSSASVFINTWYDQSGNGRNAIQLKPGNQPRIVNSGILYSMGSRSSLEFSTSLSAFLQTTAVASFLNGGPYTLNKVTAEATNNPANQFPFTTTGGSGPTNTVSHFGYRSSNLLTLAQLSHDHTFNAAAGTVLESHTAVKPNAASSQFYKNAVSLGTASNGAASYLLNVGLLNIGYFTPTSVYYNGSISEIISFPSALGTTDAGLLNNNQVLYYNIATIFWTGAVSTDWNTAGNWSTGVLPTPTSPAIALIPAGKPNYPVISASTAQANSISIDAGASLIVSGTGILQVAGAINNLGTCTANSGTVEYTGTATQGIGTGTYSANSLQNLKISNTAGVSLNGDLTVSGNLILSTGKMIITSFSLTIGGTITNTVTGGLSGSVNASLIISGTTNPSLSFDQTTAGTTNALKNLTVNSSGQIIPLLNNLVLLATGITTFTAGKLAIGSNTLTIRGLVTNTVSGGIRGSATSNMIIDGTVSPTLSFDQTTPGTTNTLSSLVLNCTGQAVLLNNVLNVGSVLTITAGTLADGGNQISSTGTLNLVAGTLKIGSATIATQWPSFSVNNISVSGTAEYASGVAQIVSGVPVYQNLTISATGGGTAASNLNVNNILNLSSANPSAILGSLSTGTFTLNMGPASTTIGAGDVTGIVKRTTILANTSYTMGNQYSFITFPNNGTLPSQMSMKIAIGVAPTWRAGMVLRTYDFIQSGGTGTKAVISAHYLDGELNGNVENNLVDFSYRVAGTVLTEHGKSNSNSTQNWISLSNVDVAFFSSTFGAVQLSFDESTLTTLTWNGSTSTSWITATNWTPNGGPSTNTNLIIPDAATTPNDPSLPATASNGSLTIQTGGIVNSDPGAQLTINNPGLDWSNNGVFNAGTSVIFFNSASGTINGTTNFANVTINSGATLQMGTDNIMRIAGLMTDNGTWNTGLLLNTVEYNGSNQDIVIPNTATYSHLIVSGAGINVFPAGVVNVNGDLTLNATITTAGNTISMNGSAAQNIKGTVPATMNNLTINNTSGNVTLNQNLKVSGALTFIAGKLAIAANTLTLAGNVINTAPNGITGSLLSNLIINSTGSLSLSFDQSSLGVSNALNNLTINSSGQVISLSGNLAVNGMLLFTAGKLAIGANSLFIKNFLTNTVSGGIRGSSASNLTVSGGLTSPSLSFDQTTPGTTNLLNNLTINSTGQSAVLDNPLSVGGILNLTDGLFQTATTASLNLLSAATFTGGSDHSFVNGPLMRNTNTTSNYIFPVGKSGSYNPITISPSASTAGTYIAEYFSALPPVAPLSTALAAIAKDEYWTVDQSGGPDAIITLPYKAGNVWSSGHPSASDLIVVSALTAGSWTPENGDAIPGNTGVGLTPLKSKLQSVSASFTFGFGPSTSLPLTLLSFTARVAEPVVLLKWITTGEYNVSRFEIERTADGSKFSQLAYLSATNTSLDKTYQWTDSAPLKGTSFYRLKMVDMDGSFEYSAILKIDRSVTDKQMNVYPNPVTGSSLQVYMQGQQQGIYEVRLFQSSGILILSTRFSHSGTNGIITVPITTFLNSGNYYLEISGPGTDRKTFQLKFN